MKLTLEQIRSITKGAQNVRLEDDGKYHFYRFSDKQMQYYKENSADFYKKSFATASVHLDFYTNSPFFKFHYDVSSGSSRRFYYFDMYVDGNLVRHLGEDNMWIMKGDISLNVEKYALPERIKKSGYVSGNPDGMCRVTLWLPNLAAAVLSEVEIADGCAIVPVKSDMTIFAWGDSITHGYDAVFPSMSYVNRVARHYNAEVINMAIGGEKFVPGLLTDDIKGTPDMITVAYGTNDWSGSLRETFDTNSVKFYAGASELYPDAKRFALLPIWRADDNRVPKNYGGTFGEASEYIRNAAKENGFIPLDAWFYVPHSPEFYSDKYLHPNDLGFADYARGLIEDIEKYIK